MVCTPLEYWALIHSLGVGVGVGLDPGAGVDILEFTSSTATLVAYHRRFR